LITFQLSHFQQNSFGGVGGARNVPQADSTNEHIGGLLARPTDDQPAAGAQACQGGVVLSNFVMFVMPIFGSALEQSVIT
jgi:hypothetical protein